MRLHHREYGSGRPLVILHGLLGAGGNWHTLGRRVFSTYFRVLVPDQRNHGRSPHSDAFDYGTMADDLEDFLDANGVTRTLLMGHSMGGKTAMEFALTRPERVERLVVVDIAPRAYPDRHRPILDAMHAVDPAVHGSREDVRQALSARLDDPAVVQLILKNVDRDEEEGMRWAVNLDAIERGYPRIMDGLETWNTYDGPTLFVRGDRSDYVRDEDAELIRAYFPDSSIATVPDAGHWVHADHPAAFSRTVLTFLGIDHPGHLFEKDR